MMIYKVLAVVVLVAGTVLADEGCQTSLGELDAVIDGSEMIDADTLDYVSRLRDEARGHLENQDNDSCVAAVQQALELLGANN